LNKIASFRKGNKDTSVKVLKEAAGVVSAVGAELGRTQNDETRRLKEANTRLSGEVEELRRQLKEFQGKVANMASSKEPVPPFSPKSPIPMEVTPPPRFYATSARVWRRGQASPLRPSQIVGVVRKVEGGARRRK